MQIKKIEKISDETRQKISLAQNVVNQNNTGKNISINGQQWRYIEVPLPNDPTVCQSVSIIDENGNGLLFTHNGLPWNGLCFPIKNNKIISDIVYSDANFSLSGTVIAKLLVDPNNSELLEKLLHKYKEVLPKTSKTSTANIANIKPKQEFNTFTLANGYTISARRNKQNQIDSIMITDTNGDGKCFYSDGYMNPVRNGKTVPEEGERTNRKEFSNLCHNFNYPNYLAMLNDVEAIMKDTKKVSKQASTLFTKHNESLNQENLIIPDKNKNKEFYYNKAHKYKEVLPKTSKTSTANIENIKPTPKQEFNTFTLANGYTISARRKEQDQIDSIMITDVNGNGKCFYSDGYMNPVKNRNGLPSQGEQHAFHKSFFSSLQQAIIEQKQDYLEKLVTQTMKVKLNLKLFKEMIDAYRTNKLPRTGIGFSTSVAKYQADNENFYIVNDWDDNYHRIYFKNSKIYMTLNKNMEIVRWSECGTDVYNFFEERFNAKYNETKQNKYHDTANIGNHSHQEIDIKQNNAQVSSSPDSKHRIIQFSNGLKISARLKPIPGQNASIMITDANGNGKCFYSDGYVNQVIHEKPITSQYEKNKIQHFAQLKILIDTQQYKSLKDLCSKFIENTINPQSVTYDKPSVSDQLRRILNTQNSREKTIEEFSNKYQASNFKAFPQDITQRKLDQLQNENIIIPNKKNSEYYYNEGNGNYTNYKSALMRAKREALRRKNRIRMIKIRMLRRKKIQHLLNSLRLRRKINNQNSQIKLTHDKLCK